MKPDYAESFSLYTRAGLRKYLNSLERQRVLSAAAALAPDQKLLGLLNCRGPTGGGVLVRSLATARLKRGRG
jgi:hypothetical protein